MATITVSSNPSTSGDTLTVNFTTDVTNISDILLSKDGGSTYIVPLPLLSLVPFSILVTGVMVHMINAN